MGPPLHSVQLLKGADCVRMLKALGSSEGQVELIAPLARNVYQGKITRTSTPAAVKIIPWNHNDVEAAEAIANEIQISNYVKDIDGVVRQLGAYIRPLERSLNSTHEILIGLVLPRSYSQSLIVSLVVRMSRCRTTHGGISSTA
eukprot:m.385255 g.385255  ORF g.385255 m.385255 type:complete len:144 (-) comp56280_c1_seq4:1878-2309(-)